MFVTPAVHIRKPSDKHTTYTARKICTINSVIIFFREKFSGIKPPVLRSEIDFDAGSKYHIAANIPYIR